MPVIWKPIIDNPVIASDPRERGNLLRIFFSFGIQFYLSQFQARFLSPNDPHPRRRNAEVRCQSLDNFLIGFSLGRWCEHTNLVFPGTQPFYPWLRRPGLNSKSEIHLIFPFQAAVTHKESGFNPIKERVHALLKAVGHKK